MRPRVRSALLLLVLLAMIGIALRSAWTWLVTTPETRYFAGQQVPGAVLFDGIRVLRWGEDKGKRHGPFRVELADAVVFGRFDRGRHSGTWRCFGTDGRLRWEAEVVPWGTEEPVRVGPATIHVLPRGEWRAECGITGWVPRRWGSFFCVFQEADGYRVATARPADLHALETEGVFYEFDAEDRVRLIGDMFRGRKDGLWTWFGDDGRPVRQEVYLLGDRQDVRVEEPWYDVHAGLVQWITDPVTGKPVELPVTR